MLNFFRDLSIKKKLFLGFGSIMGILVVSTAISYYKVEQVKFNTENILNNTILLQGKVSDWRQNIQKNLIRDKSIMLVKNDSHIIETVKKDMQATSAEVSQLQESITKAELTSNEKTQLEKIATIRADYRSSRDNAVSKKIELLSSTNPSDEALVNNLIQEVSVKRENYIQSVISFEKMVTQDIKKQEEQLIKDLNSFELMFFSLTLFSIIFGTIFAYLVSKNILDKIQQSLKLAEEIKNGNLTYSIESHSKDELGQLMFNLNAMSAGLREMLVEIKENGVQVDTFSNEIASGNTELSGRTESQAAALEEAAASLEEFTGTLATTSDHAVNAENMTQELSVTAHTSGDMMKSVVKVMSGIQESSKQIGEIVSLIDTIAFQTNLLALNAAVEAARAGEHGRGFAVVAKEVRELSQKTATASKDIKGLIQSSANEVKSGVELVNKTGSNIEQLLSRIEEVSHFMAQINGAIKEQKLGISQINEAVSHIDGITQENANLAATNSESSNLLKMQSKHLNHLIERFKYD